MGYLKHKAIYLKIFIVLLFLHQLVLANDDFNDIATCIYKKDLKGVEELLAKGIDVNIREETMGSTPLIVACSLEGTDEIIELLISKGADVNAQLTGADATGWTALMFASSNGKLDLVKYLISKEADVHLEAKDGTTALNLAMKGNNDKIVEMLKSKEVKE